jgi:hypothetical protein
MQHDTDDLSTYPGRLKAALDIAGRTSTLRDHAHRFADTEGGRFAFAKAHQPPMDFSGVPTYPRLPPNSPWATADPSGVEPPLGTDVNALRSGPAPATPAVETTDGGRGASLNAPRSSFQSQAKTKKD